SGIQPAAAGMILLDGQKYNPGTVYNAVGNALTFKNCRFTVEDPQKIIVSTVRYAHDNTVSFEDCLFISHDDARFWYADNVTYNGYNTAVDNQVSVDGTNQTPITTLN
ncbi:MAG: hypothetical protein LBC26_06225, partial [Oscillospiraceae bacterium]|nr:hypothetical protein [Oscillospiraceae bacterium]